MLSEKQKIIIKALSQKPELTLNECVDLIGFGIYHNNKKYVMESISRMVKRKLIKRVRRGVYSLPKPDDYIQENDAFKF